MNARRGRYRNPFSFRSLVVILLGAILGTVWMVSRVAGRNRLHQMTQEQRKLESEIGLLKREIDMMEKRVQSLLTLDDALNRIKESGVDLDRDFPAILPTRLYLLPPETVAAENASTAAVTPSEGVAAASLTPES